MTRREKDSAEETAPEASAYEPSPVESWRLHILEEAGYPFGLAQRISMSAADLHIACEMLEQGCSPETAADILL